MSKIENEDFVGAYVDEKLVCKNCLTDEENIDLTLDDVLTLDEIEKDDDLYFCDRCKNRIS